MQVPGTALQEGYILCDMAPHKIPHLFATYLGPQPPRYKEGSPGCLQISHDKAPIPPSDYLHSLHSLLSLSQQCPGQVRWVCLECLVAKHVCTEFLRRSIFTDSFLSAVLFSGKNMSTLSLQSFLRYRCLPGTSMSGSREKRKLPHNF